MTLQNPGHIGALQGQPAKARVQASGEGAPRIPSLVWSRRDSVTGQAHPAVRCRAQRVLSDPWATGPVLWFPSGPSGHLVAVAACLAEPPATQPLPHGSPSAVNEPDEQRECQSERQANRERWE